MFRFQVSGALQVSSHVCFVSSNLLPFRVLGPRIASRMPRPCPPQTNSWIIVPSCPPLESNKKVTAQQYVIFPTCAQQLRFLGHRSSWCFDILFHSHSTIIRLLGPFIQNCDDINPLKLQLHDCFVKRFAHETFMEQPPLLYSGPSHDAKSTMCLCTWRLPSLAALDILQLLNWGIWVLRRIFVQNKGFASLIFFMIHQTWKLEIFVQCQFLTTAVWT